MERWWSLKEQDPSLDFFLVFAHTGSQRQVH